MEHRVTVPCSKSKLRDIRLFVGKVLKEHQLSEVEINKLVLAVDEVCSNLIIHSHKCNPKDFIELLIKRDNGRLVFEIRDEGEGFNITNYKEPDIAKIVKDRRKGGIGLMLVKRIMDDIEFTTDTNHNICRLFKNVAPA